MRAGNVTRAVKINSLQPSQLFISGTKLDKALRRLDSNVEPEPIPVKEMDGELVITDGHTRALALMLRGLDEAPTVEEDEELGWEEYRIYVFWCKEEGVHSVADLRDRILGDEEYETLWLERCRRMRESVQGKKQKR
jgi:hypothetical protein